MITPFSTNVVSALRASGIDEICRVEKSRRYLIQLKCNIIYQQKFKHLFVNKRNSTQILDIFGDKMTECEYLSTNLPNFKHSKEKSFPSFFGKIKFFLIKLLISLKKYLKVNYFNCF